ncbi:MAG TPA: RNA-directed DNA polymerase, partial [Thermoplasmata archaeon]|nr:RNA-directed DNA polymerase [Thermoplasmata archaeon]
AHFDLAAHYDTIDHKTLAEQISKKTYVDFTDLLKKCLVKWSAQKSNKLNHGIPQGPIASNLLAEIHMLPIDKKLNRKNIRYVRYGDDIKIFGKTREEVLSGVILLEEECRERGLIPQSKKYEIVKATCVEEAIGKFPSLKEEEKKTILSNSKKTYQLFIEAFDEKKFNISKVKYILKVSNKNKKILSIVLQNLNKYPSLIDEFFQFLLNYTDELKVRNKIYSLCIKNPSPYDYVDGKYWELLSYFHFEGTEKRLLVDRAIGKLKKSRKKYALKIGLYIFLCSTNTCLILGWLNTESSSLTQMVIVPYIPKDCIDKEDYKRLLQTFFRHSNYEPAIVTIKEVIYNLKFNILNNLKPPKKDESGVINNILGKPEEIDSIGQIIKNRYKIGYYNKWKRFLGTDYDHANKVIFLADNAYYTDKNAWVNYINVFNNIVVKKFISLLYTNYPTIKWPKIKNRNDVDIPYGSLLDKNNQLSKQFPKIIDGFYSLHKRRVKTPLSHPYDKSAVHTTVVTGKEQKVLYKKLKISYSELIKELRRLI